MKTLVQKHHTNIQEVVQQTVDTITSPAATGVTGAGGIWVFFQNEIATIVGVLTALVLLCQLAAWGYKVYKHFTKDK